MKKAPNRFLRAIYASARAHNVTNEGLHETIWMAFQKKSVKELTTAQALELLDGLNGKKRPAGLSAERRQAMNSHGRKGHHAATEYLVNERERRLLSEAASMRGWPEETLTGFVARQIGCAEVRTMAEFNKVFWALKSMNRRDGLCA